MTRFEGCLQRLKLALHVSTDQEVAARLGMSKAAFSARKVRGAFPEEKLRAVASLHPEWHLDVANILNGQTAVEHTSVTPHSLLCAAYDRSTPAGTQLLGLAAKLADQPQAAAAYGALLLVEALA